MGAILSFPDDRRERRSKPLPAGESGRILLFTGVCIEREGVKPPRGPAICSPPTRRKRPNPSRIRNKA